MERREAISLFFMFSPWVSIYTKMFIDTYDTSNLEQKKKTIQNWNVKSKKIHSHWIIPTKTNQLVSTSY